MGTFSTVLSLTAPAGGDSIALGDDQMRADKVAWAERLALEHNFPSASFPSAAGGSDTAADAFGRHQAGKVAAVLISSSAPTGIVSGSLWFDTTATENCLKIYNGTNWTTYRIGNDTNIGLLAFRAYVDGTAQTVASTWTALFFANETYDYGTAFTSGAATGYFTAPITGLYAFSTTIYLKATSTAGIGSVGLYNGSTIIAYGTYGALTSSGECFHLSTTALLTAADKVYVYGYSNVAATRPVSGTTANTFFEGRIISRT